MIAFSQADKFNIRTHKGAVQPRKRMTRDEALRYATIKTEAAAAARAAGRSKGSFGTGEFKVLKDGPINAPFWVVVEIR